MWYYSSGLQAYYQSMRGRRAIDNESRQIVRNGCRTTRRSRKEHAQVEYHLGQKNISSVNIDCVLKHIASNEEAANRQGTLALVLSHNAIANKELAYLAKSKLNLVSLNLSQNRIGNEGCGHLAKGQWDNLNELNLNDNSIDEKGCLLLSFNCWNKLTWLSIAGNPVGKKGLAYLCDRHPLGLTICDKEYQDGQ